MLGYYINTLYSMFDTSHIHPMLVHFPIALTLLGVLLSAFKLFKPTKFRYPCGEIILRNISLPSYEITFLLYVSQEQGVKWDECIWVSFPKSLQQKDY